MRNTTVGADYGALNRSTGEPSEDRRKFDPANKPTITIEGIPTWEEVNEQWKRTTMVEAAMIRQSPSAAFFLGKDGAEGMAKLKGTADIKEARAVIATALTDLAGKIDKAVPLIGDDLTFLDFPPIHQQLMIGTPSPSGTNWSKPVEKAVAGEEISDANVAHLLSTLGLATLGAAFFIFASIATAGGAAALGAFLFAGGAVTSVGTAAASWDRYRDLSVANAATVDPELALVSGEQVDEAFMSAILDSVFALVDAWQGVKGAAGALSKVREARGLLAAGKAGAEGSARAALQGLGKAGVNNAEIIGKAVGELGPEEVRKLTGLSYGDMAKQLGEGSPLGTRLLELAEKGLSEGTKELLAKLPKLGELGAEEGEQVLRAAIDTHGIAGTLDRVGGWAAIKKTPVMKGGAGTAAALEGWRQGLVKELQDYIAKESEDVSKAVRTGTEAASSDVDVQIVNGTASALQQKAESWLAGRVGKDVEGAKKLLDAEIFVDPFRSHFYDIVEGLDDAVRQQIADKMGDYERRMIEGSKIKQAGGIESAAGKRIAEESPIKNPFLDFEPLAPAEQKKVAGMIDGWMAEVKQAKSAEEKASLVEKISKSQAQINASHPDAYVGGGVAVWVTGREDALEDVRKLAEAIGMDPAELLKVGTAQRVSAALAEGKWLEGAIKKLSVPAATSAEDLGVISKAVTDIGKHGAREVGQLSRAGAPNARILDELFGELLKLKDASSESISAAIKAGKLPEIEAKITGLLEQVKGASKTAIEGIEKDLKSFASTAEQMADWQLLLLWQTRYAAIADQAIQATSTFMKFFHAYLEERMQASLPENQPNQSVVPSSEPEPAGAAP
jgi:hypothetical protein